MEGMASEACTVLCHFVNSLRQHFASSALAGALCPQPTY